MLIIERRAGESIYIGDNVEVKVLDIQGGKVSLGFEAPKEVRITRPEAAGSGKR